MIFCDICGKPHHAQRLPFLCAVDARNRCYDGRIKNVQALLENEGLCQQIDDLILQSSRDEDVQPPTGAPNRSIAVRFALSEQREAEDRTSGIIDKAQKLAEEIAAARKEIENRKAAIARRKNDLASASVGLDARRSRQLDETERSIQMLKYKWNRSADAMARTRSFLCVEAAKLYGLRRIKKGNSSSRYEYRIGGINVIDLESMHSASPEQLSTSLANIAHILALTSHYLSIRLPAELTLPHRDYPRPTIFTLASSYQHGQVPFPGSPNFGAESNQTQHPRPRPLFVDKALPQLAKEEPAMYSLFLEGVALLAYDVAWACSTQGVSVGDKNSFEDVCHIGRNLYNLLIAQQHHTSQAGKLIPPAIPPSDNKTENVDLDSMAQAISLMGRYSHGTAHSFLGGAEGSDFVRSFKLPSPVKLADKLKKKLISEVAIPEWEVLEEEAWAETNPVDGDDGVVIGEQDAKQLQDKEIPQKGVATSNETRSGSGNGTSGWTKVKNR